MSNKSGEGIGQVKEQACRLLNEFRNNAAGDPTGGNPHLQREEQFLKGVYIAKPKTVNPERVPHIPERFGKLDRATLKEIQEANGGAGVFNFPL